ncbi:hypothetical protein HMPREF1544_11794 [Mucor circinelloides 1006PhL]|uniref:GDP/GTP exchange factor Sec2 N-terminal domain-containing protein n=1 Tax=Mucor circinelloides f. circinelloides (strain 1006PhL) TaxID=1220926 RepID=S2IV27_MUCC1|nr:hypothetical protein HMPREF1544_11794 [Mucor circinelloides 1006PhL]
MATETTTTATEEQILNLNINIKPDGMIPPVVALDKTYQDSSNSTTSTNSPVISIKSLECQCHGISSDFECLHCRNMLSFESIQTEYNETKTQLHTLQLQRTTLRHEKDELASKTLQLEKTLTEKQQSIETTCLGIQSLQHDLKVLEVKCKEETSQVINIQQSKENVKKELEDLTVKLFEEANSMITIEKAEQQVIRARNDQLQQELEEAQSLLKNASIELTQIRNKMEDSSHVYSVDEQPQPPQSPNSTQIEDCNTLAESNVIDTYTRAQVETILMHGLDLGLYMDTLEDQSALEDLNDFIQLVHKTPLRKLHSLKYMRYCIRDDIEPCLRFGPNPKMSSKKIMDAILVKTCFVEECPEGFVTEQATRQLKEEASATLWERFTTSSVFLGCQACGRDVHKSARQEELKYRFRISYFDEWACIDRYCRDRLQAVIEFYLFIRHLRAGVYKHRSLHELYQQSVRLRLQMFLARMGALPNMLQNCGIHHEKIAMAFHGEDINHSVILLSESTIERLSSSTESSITVSTIESSRTSASSSCS